MFAEPEHKSQQQQQQQTVVQPKLEVGAKDDEHEKEADAIASKVMRMGENGGADVHAQSGNGKVMKMGDHEEDKKLMKMGDHEEPKNLMKMGDHEEPKVLMKMGDHEEPKGLMKMGDHEEPKGLMKMGDHEEPKSLMKMGDAPVATNTIAPKHVEAGIQNSKGNGQSLPENVQQDIGGKMGADLSNVKIHTDANAHEMSTDINAKAFTHGQDIYFKNGNYNPASPSGKELLTHELVHTQQQKGGVQREIQRKPTEGDSGRVLRQGTALRSSAKKDKQDPYSNIIADLNAGEPVIIHEKINGFLKVTVARNGNKQTGYVSSELIVNFSENERIHEISNSKETVVSGNEFEISSANLKGTIFYTTVGTTMSTVAIEEIVDSGLKGSKIKIDTAKIKSQFIKHGVKPNVIYASFPGEEGYQIVYSLYLQQNRITGFQGPAIDPNSLLDKIQQKKFTASMSPGPWMPGNQPPPFYIGNTAHEAIADYYRIFHIGETVYTNYIPVASILGEYELKGFKVDWKRLNAIEMMARPDILNGNSKQLYEIKPWSSQDVAIEDADWYTSIFIKAGIPMQLGSQADPGANGVLPAPGGFFVFTSPFPGVIIYRYQKSLPVTVPVGVKNPVPDPKKVPDTPGVFDMKYWEKVTGLTGIALIIYLIISEGSRLFPPRNLIPVP